MAQPNVSHCIQENEVHYAEPQVLPGNEEVWELYPSLVCDIFTSRTTSNSSYALAPVTNDCGQSVLPGGVGLWVQRIQETFNPPIYTAVT